MCYMNNGIIHILTAQWLKGWNSSTSQSFFQESFFSIEKKLHDQSQKVTKLIKVVSIAQWIV